MKKHNLFSLASKVCWTLLMVTFLFTCDPKSQTNSSTATTPNAEEGTTKVEDAAKDARLGYYLEYVEDDDPEEGGFSMTIELLPDNKFNTRLGVKTIPGTYEFSEDNTKIIITSEGITDTLLFKGDRIEQTIPEINQIAVYDKVSESEVLKGEKETVLYFEKIEKRMVDYDEENNNTHVGKYTLTDVTGNGATATEIETKKNAYMGFTNTLELRNEGTVNFYILGTTVAGTYIINSDQSIVTVTINGHVQDLKLSDGKLISKEEGVFLEFTK